MGFAKHKFGLFFSLPLDPQDWLNLQASSVCLVMLPLEFADNQTLDRLKGMGVRVVLRVNESDYYDDLAPGRIRNHVFTANQHCPVAAVIVGNEPDHPLDWRYGSNTWGQEWAYLHRRRFDAVRLALQAIAAKVVSPAVTMRAITEDDVPQPGRTTWREIMCLPDEAKRQGYLEADGNGVHLYQHAWDGPVNMWRVKVALREYEELWHQPLWIDEVGVVSASGSVARMQAYIDIAEMLLSHPLGWRVECLIPFVANGSPGNPPSWPPQYLMRDPQAYALLGAWMRA